MRDYINQMITDFPVKLGLVTCPWTEKLFKVDKTAKDLGKTRRHIFHSFVMKAMFFMQEGETGYLTCSYIPIVKNDKTK